MININLLPDVKVQFLKTQRTKYRFISIAVVSSVVALALVILMAVYVKGVQRLQLSKTRDSVKTNQNKLTSDKDAVKVVTIQNQLASLTSLTDKKPIMSRTFGYIQTAVANNIGLSSVNVDPSSSTITLTGSTDSYKTANAFADVLKHAKLSYKDSNDQTQSVTPFTNVVFANLGSGSSSDGNSSVSFSVSFTYDSNLFSGSISKPKITIPSLNSAQINQPDAKTTARSDQNTTPFGDKAPTDLKNLPSNPNNKAGQ